MNQIYLSWKRESGDIRDFIEKLNVPSVWNSSVLHVFIGKDERKKPPAYPWIILHESLTSASNASQVDLIAFLLQQCYSEETRGQIGKQSVYLVQTTSGEYDELLAVFNTMGTFHEKYDLNILIENVVEGEQEKRVLVSPQGGLLDAENVCPRCYISLQLAKEIDNRYDCRCENPANLVRMTTGLRNAMSQTPSSPCIWPSCPNMLPLAQCDCCSFCEVHLNASARSAFVCPHRANISRHERPEWKSSETRSRVNGRDCISEQMDVGNFGSMTDPNAKIHGCSVNRQNVKPVHVNARNAASQTEPDAVKICRCSSDGVCVCMQCFLDKQKQKNAERRVRSIRCESAPGALSVNVSEDFTTSTARRHGEDDTEQKSGGDSKPVFDSHVFDCVFCPLRKYRSRQLLDVHMRNNHKKCNCPCREYFKSRVEYLDHFYHIYPLACLEGNKCPERFRCLHYQAIHHRDNHYSERPFHCVPCQDKAMENKKSALRVSFKDMAGLRIHARAHGHDLKDLLLVNSESDADENRLPFNMRCSEINHC